MKGQYLRITIGGKYVAFAKSCNLHVGLNLESSHTKDDADDAQRQKPTGTSWDLSADALYSVDADTTGINGIGALDAILAKQLVNVEFVQVAGAKNRVPVAGSVKYSGQAWVNDIDINAQDETESTYTIKLTGDGPLTKTTLAAGSGT